jgi:hypothetical protein
MITGPDNIKDGLVLYLDAGNSKSYIGSGDTWIDLTKSGNFTLNGGYSFTGESGGAIYFDGEQNSYSTDSNTNRTKFMSKSFSISFWVNPTDTTSIDQSAYSRICEKGGWPTSYFLIQLNSSTGSPANAFNFSGRDSNSVDFGVTTTSNIVELNKWQYVTCVMDRVNKVCSIYKNSQFVTSANLNTNLADLNSNGAFRVPSSFAELGGKISIFTIHEKALLPQEILQNYNATKSRFGL